MLSNVCNYNENPIAIFEIEIVGQGAVTHQIYTLFLRESLTDQCEKEDVCICNIFMKYLCF